MIKQLVSASCWNERVQKNNSIEDQSNVAQAPPAPQRESADGAERGYSSRTRQFIWIFVLPPHECSIAWHQLPPAALPANHISLRARGKGGEKKKKKTGLKEGGRRWCWWMLLGTLKSERFFLIFEMPQKWQNALPCQDVRLGWGDKYAAVS